MWSRTVTQVAQRVGVGQHAVFPAQRTLSIVARSVMQQQPRRLMLVPVHRECARSLSALAGASVHSVKRSSNRVSSEKIRAVFLSASVPRREFSTEQKAEQEPEVLSALPLEEQLKAETAALEAAKWYRVNDQIPSDVNGPKDKVEMVWNPFGAPVLDVRLYAITKKVRPTEEEQKRFDDIRGLSGEQHDGKEPENAVAFPVKLNFQFPVDPNSADTLNEPATCVPLYRADNMQEKWDLFLRKRKMFFVRSWDDKLLISTDAELKHVQQPEVGMPYHVFSLDLSEALVSRDLLKGLDLAAEETQSYVMRLIEFLVKGWFFGQVSVHPLPPNLRDAPRQELTKHSVDLFGAQCGFASFEKVEIPMPRPHSHSHGGEPCHGHHH